jgi:outer membrane protein TolC
MTRVFRPSVNAEARYAFIPNAFGYDKYYLNFQENVASIGVSVVLPVLTGGRDSAQAAQSRARLEQVEAQRHLRALDLTRQAREGQAQLAQAKLEAGIARRAVALAGETLSQAQSISREGRGEADAVDRAALALADAEDELARSRRDEVDARLRLLAVEGRLLEALDSGSREPAQAP